MMGLAALLEEMRTMLAGGAAFDEQAVRAEVHAVMQYDKRGIAWRSSVARHLGVPVESQLVEDVEIVTDRWEWQREAAPDIPTNEIRRNIDASLTHLRASRAALKRAGAWVSYGERLDVWPRRRDGGAVADAFEALESLIESGAGIDYPLPRGVVDEDLVRLLAGIWHRAGRPYPMTFDRRRPFGRFVDDVTAEKGVSREAANRALAGK